MKPTDEEFFIRAVEDLHEAVAAGDNYTPAMRVMLVAMLDTYAEFGFSIKVAVRALAHYTDASLEGAERNRALHASYFLRGLLAEAYPGDNAQDSAE